VTAPDLPDELDRWEPESLAAGFTIEGARVDADLSGATVIDTRFAGSELRSVELAEVRLTRVDLRGSQLEEPRGGVTNLRGAIVDPVQLVGLAPMLAHGLGIVVAE
jgi:uncharacterized protein YjbI with pentapeptide repeats